jgi:geranylgeranyl pyrophosphate synthase
MRKMSINNKLNNQPSKDIKTLESFSKGIKKDLDLTMRELLGSNSDTKLRQIINYQIFIGGKRLRPLLAIVCYNLLGGKKLENVLYPAAGLEILHNYTLIIDDIIDNSFLRRGEKTCWAKFGKSITQCIGIEYSATIFQSANRSENRIRISEIFAKIMKVISEGEILDILFEQGERENEPYIIKNRYLEIKHKDYLEMVGKKTASLFEACCEVGGICANAQEKEINALKKYGFNLGIAFQIRDDILDIFSQETVLGKKIGKDIIEKKLGNIVVLYALKEFVPRDKKEFLRIIRKKNITNKDVKQAMALIKKTDSKAKADLLGKNFIKRAKKSLDSLPQNKWNDILKEFANFIVEREK